MAKVLIVDDEPGYLELLRSILTRDGHEVATAETGESAVEVGQGACPDVLLADWRLQGSLSGLDVARKLQTHNPALATIIMTGYSRAQIVAEGQDVKNLRILEKPFGLAKVRGLIREASAPQGEAPT